jgi:hypothetical protein
MRARASGGRARRARATPRCGWAWSRRRGRRCAVRLPFLAAQYRRLVRRLGDKRAVVAVAHSIVVIVYHILTRKEPYRELGADYFERRKPEAQVNRLTRQIEKLGYTVTVTPPATVA